MKKWMWQEFLLPRWKGKHWTWKSYFLLSLGVFSFVDSMFIPISHNVDPGRSGERMLLLILGFRAAYKNEPPLSVLTAGAALAALAASLNHGLVKPFPFWISAALSILLPAFVIFWGRAEPISEHRPKDDFSTQSRPDPKSTLKL